MLVSVAASLSKFVFIVHLTFDDLQLKFYLSLFTRFSFDTFCFNIQWEMKMKRSFLFIFVREMKRRAEGRKEWREWVPGTCLRAEHLWWWWWWWFKEYKITKSLAIKYYVKYKYLKQLFNWCKQHINFSKTLNYNEWLKTYIPSRNKSFLCHGLSQWVEKLSGAPTFSITSSLKIDVSYRQECTC